MYLTLYVRICIHMPSIDAFSARSNTGGLLSLIFSGGFCLAPAEDKIIAGALRVSRVVRSLYMSQLGPGQSSITSDTTIKHAER